MNLTVTDLTYQTSAHISLSNIRPDYREANDHASMINMEQERPNSNDQNGSVPSTPQLPHEELTPHEAQEHADAFLKTIFREFDFLSPFVVRYEARLRKRWNHLTSVKRKALLEQIKSELPKERNDALQLYFKEGLDAKPPIPRKSALLPYLNVEDCCKDPSHLLGMLHFRGRMLPEEFFVSDTLSLQPAASLGVIKRTSAKNYGMQLKGHKDGYGKFVEISSSGSRKSNTCSADSRNPLSYSDYALLVLEAQSYLLQFVSQWAVALLAPSTFDMADPPEDESLEPPEIMTSLARQNIGSRKGWTLLAETNSLRPFLPPSNSNFSLDRMRRVILAMKGYSQDRLFLLRTDAEDLFHTLESYDAHRPERIVSANMQKLHMELERPPYYDRLVESITKEIFGDIIAWSLVEEQFQYLVQFLGDEQIDVGRVGDATGQREIIERAQRLEALVMIALDYRLRVFSYTVKSSPALRTLFCRSHNKTGEPVNAHFKSEDDPNTLFDSDRLLWLLHRSIEGNQSSFALGAYLDEIELLVQTDKKAAARLSPLVRDGVSYLSCLNEILTNLWCLGLHTSSSLPPSETGGLEVGQWDELQLMYNPEKNGRLYLGKFATPFSRFSKSSMSTSPVKTKKKNKKNEEQQNNPTMAEENLKAFWKAVKAEYELDIVSSLIDGRMLNFDVSAMLKPGAPQASGLDTTSTNTSKNAQPTNVVTDKENDTGTPAPTSRHVHGRKKSVHFPDKLVIVTRTKHEPESHPMPPPTPTLKTPTRLSFDNPLNDPLGFSPLSKRILPERLFKAATKLFPEQDEHDQQQRDAGFIEWKDFLALMIALDFDVEKKRGSFFQFSKLSGVLVTSLYFPAPESGKLTPMEIRNIGRRLTRRLGLDISHFALG